MSERTVYLAGYSGREPDWLLSAALRLDAVVWDIRFSPRSRRPEWSQVALMLLLGDRYRHVGAFGNVRYQTNKIELANPERGLAEFDTETPPVILLCQCRASATCHRDVVAGLLVAERGARVVELDDAISELDGRQLSMFGERE